MVTGLLRGPGAVDSRLVVTRQKVAIDVPRKDERLSNGGDERLSGKLRESDALVVLELTKMVVVRVEDLERGSSWEEELLELSMLLLGVDCIDLVVEGIRGVVRRVDLGSGADQERFDIELRTQVGLSRGDWARRSWSGVAAETGDVSRHGGVSGRAVIVGSRAVNCYMVKTLNLGASQVVGNAGEAHAQKGGGSGADHGGIAADRGEGDAEGRIGLVAAVGLVALDVGDGLEEACKVAQFGGPGARAGAASSTVNA